MRFLDREGELRRLNAVSRRPEGGLVVLWGRRRIGKTRLLLEWARGGEGLYTVADRSAEQVQRQYLAESVAERLPGFADVTYPDWRAALRALARGAVQAGWRGPLILDEFAYLAAASPALPSIVQAWLDHEARQAELIVALAGSAQHMMQGLVLDESAPLYGRAIEAMRVPPLPAPYLREALGLACAHEVVMAYTAWGGVPRYWELAEPYGADLDAAVEALVLDPLGPLHLEPDHVLDAEVPPATALRPILDVVGGGVHRVSEIGARLGQPASSLARPLARLAMLGLLHKEQPFGDSERGGKRSLYKLAEPFLRLWFRVVAPHRSLLAAAPGSRRLALWRGHRAALFAETWEELCRMAVPRLGSRLGIEGWLPASRHWSAAGPEWDVVSRSADGDLLLGEAKWHEGVADAGRVRKALAALLAKGTPKDLPARSTLHVVFLPRVAHEARDAAGPAVVVDAGDVLAALDEDGGASTST